jgi:restriction system protein
MIKMSENQIRVGAQQIRYSASGYRILSYFVEMSHDGLNEHKIISAPNGTMLDHKITIQKRRWMEKWATVSSKRKTNEERATNLEEAQRRTEEARNAQAEIENILLHTLSVNDAVNWEDLKKKESYPEPKPSKPFPKSKKEYPNKPVKQEPTFSFVEKMFNSKRALKIKEYEDRYLKALYCWEEEKAAVDQFNDRQDLTYKYELMEWEKEVGLWENRKKLFFEEQKKFNDGIDEMKKKYLSGNPVSVTEYCDMVLNNSEYPDSFPNNFETEYNRDNKMLIIEYQLPSKKDIPNIKEVKYVASRNELKEVLIPEPQINKIFDDTMYKITLRTLHEIFESDVVNAIDAVSFNGWVKSTNKATGKEENNCILSIQAKKSDFVNIDLANVDPKTCFKTLKGVASSRLSTLTPIQPILQINRFDKRFVDSYEVADEIDNSTNIAAMDWEDFEHLIRELFEKEFSVNGGEVKVTQASRDGGVDAVAFDPDPIRGGKIVIQAKRYTNTVGVSAVRDLFGTVLNEGATKGILVTTADYGSDSYEFAKGKPLTLLNGSNLLHLLEKHGVHAKIDLREAKRILNEAEK